MISLKNIIPEKTDYTQCKELIHTFNFWVENLLKNGLKQNPGASSFTEFG